MGVSDMPARQCPWCSASVPEGATNCPSCQAALVDATGGMAIPGVTAVDPEVIVQEAATRKRLERVKNQAPGGAGLGLMGGGLLGALVAGAVKAAANSRADDDGASPTPGIPTGQWTQDAPVAAGPNEIPGQAAPVIDPWAEPAAAEAPPWGPVGTQPLDATPLARPNELSDMGEPNVAHWPGAADPASSTDPSGTSETDPPPWGPLKG
jgi:hypothetical protein